MSLVWCMTDYLTYCLALLTDLSSSTLSSDSLPVYGCLSLFLFLFLSLSLSLSLVCVCLSFTSTPSPPSQVYKWAISFSLCRSTCQAPPPPPPSYIRSLPDNHSPIDKLKLKLKLKDRDKDKEGIERKVGVVEWTVATAWRCTS